MNRDKERVRRHVFECQREFCQHDVSDNGAELIISVLDVEVNEELGDAYESAT